MTDEVIFDPEEKLTSLFQPDTLISHQYFATFRRQQLEPEKKLMLAVLEDAVACFQKYILPRNSRERTLFKETEDWFRNRNDTYLFSFENICDALRLNPEYVREGLLRWKQKMITQYQKTWPINVFSATHEIFVRRSNTGRIISKLKPACQTKRIVRGG
ncbi:MAG TPA: hypothetical protein VIE89_34015 [Candidatus Binatia bacterium]|jgi:hypothetical protein